MRKADLTPELLAPAGSYESLCAAIEAGADAVYMGGEYNARAFARNFDREAIREALRLCRGYGVKAYITLNTLVYEREMREWLEYARYLYESGADAFITADLGAAMRLREYIPDVRLHASTQMSVHNAEGVRTLAQLGYERVVVARELTGAELARVVARTNTEIEAFVHGALCVSASGQCLFSSIVGGRSGNRGECAQPCRLTYNGAAVLSLRDNCLAAHIRELCDMGVSSLKIEGRMKTPEYVYGTVSTYRRLLDERRDATRDEIERMARLFSRSGFTDGYYTGKTHGMCGVRTETDKQKSADVPSFSGLERKIPIDIKCEIKKNEPASLTLSMKDKSVTVTGSVPTEAKSAPIDEQTVVRSLCRMGATPYTCADVDITLEDGLYMRVSELNSLRRAATDALLFSTETVRSVSASLDAVLEKESVDAPSLGASARFVSKRQLDGSGVTTEQIPRIYLPLCDFDGDGSANGVILPPLVYGGEWESFCSSLERARARGAEYAICSNISQIKIAKEAGYTVTADFRLNCTNPYTAAELRALGADEIILSPELKAGAMRDIHGQKSVIVYGKLPLMLCERCVIEECGGCDTCRRGEPYYLVDRTGARFAAFGIEGHRSVIYNSVPIYAADMRRELSRIGSFADHYIFSDESGSEIRAVLLAYREGKSAARVLMDGAKYRRL